MPGEIPDHDCIVRYCRPHTIHKNMITSEAFEVRDVEEYLSVNWISNAADTGSALEQVRLALGRKNFRATANGRFVVFNVGIIKSYVYKSTGIRISIRHRPSSLDSTHAGIHPIKKDETVDKQKLRGRMAFALLGFVHKHPDSIYKLND